MHGLSKLLTGHMWERFLWFSVLFASLSIVFFFTYGFYFEYRNYDIRTEFRTKTSQHITLPTITICDAPSALSVFDDPDTTLSMHNMCYKNLTISGKRECPTRQKLYDAMSQNSYDYITPHKAFPQCVIFNHFGNITSKVGTTELIFGWNFEKKLNLWIHDEMDLAGDETNLVIVKPHLTIDFSSSQEHRITFSDKQVIFRLPEPYPSNCSSGQYDDNLLSGNYTLQKCKYTCLLRAMISKCKAVPDEFLNYLPHLQALLPKYDNRTTFDVRHCLNEAVRNSTQMHCDCRFACREMNIRHKNTSNSNGFGAYLFLTYDSNRFMEITEIPVYPATKFVTDIGGWMGLFSGTSFLSILEVLLFTILSMLGVYRKLKRSINRRWSQRQATNKYVLESREA